MKKLICFILLLLIVAASCAVLPSCEKESGDTVTDTDAPVGETTQNEDTSETLPPVPVYDGIFKVGYGIEDITPTEPIPLNTGDILDKVQEPLYATCVAVNDGTNTLLIFTVDIKNFSDAVDEELRGYISSYTKVPKKNIVLNAMHNHSAPTPNIPASNGAIHKWTQNFYKLMLSAAKTAIADLSDATVKMGTAKTTNFAFVRRYIHADGSFSSIHYSGASSSPIVKHESDADDTAQIVRFVREGKKDVLITNWQAHAAHAIGNYPSSISGDYVYHFRNKLQEKDDDLLVAFYCGASGNINLTVRVQSLNVCGANYKKVGIRLAEAVYNQLENLEDAQPGKIQSLTKTYKGVYREVDQTRLAGAKAIQSSGVKEDTTEYKALLTKYGLHSKYEVNKLINIDANKGKTIDVPIRALSFGDLAFVTVPYEMFDTNGMEVKDGSPYKMTFILGTTGGAMGYVPSALAVKNGGYEVYTSIFKYGTAEEVVAELLDMLNTIKNKK